MNKTMMVILTGVMLLSLAATLWDFSFIPSQSQAIVAVDPDEQRDLPR